MVRPELLGAAIFGALLGVALGLFAGRAVWPVAYDTVTPDMLATHYQVDYATMIAVAYAGNGLDAGDLALARSRLARLGPAATVILQTAAADDVTGAAARLLRDLGSSPVAPPPTVTERP